jgi:2-methylisocitrate lyase-like PEP mutase family enzyme
MTNSNFSERRAAFRRLHERGCFVIPNPWDAGAAKILAGLGFKALATTSSGFAWSRGRRDGSMTVDEVLESCREIVPATPLPVNADFEDGYAPDPAGVKTNVRRCIETGVAGLSIEDSTGAPSRPLYDLETAVARLRAARGAIDESGEDVLLVARAECFLVGHAGPLEESIRRLRAYAAAGADCLYAPGLSTLDQIDAIIAAVEPKPVNVLVGRPGLFTLQDLEAHGVRRVSVGGALAGAAWGGMMRAAQALAAGRFDGFAGNLPHPEIEKIMG